MVLPLGPVRTKLEVALTAKPLLDVRLDQLRLVVFPGVALFFISVPSDFLGLELSMIFLFEDLSRLDIAEVGLTHVVVQGFFNRCDAGSTVQPDNVGRGVPT